jgi:hypothetical protein
VQKRGYGTKAFEKRRQEGRRAKNTIGLAGLNPGKASTGLPCIKKVSPTLASCVVFIPQKIYPTCPAYLNYTI